MLIQTRCQATYGLEPRNPSYQGLLRVTRDTTKENTEADLGSGYETAGKATRYLLQQKL